MIQNYPKISSDIAEGSLFRRGMGGSMSEIAEVVEVGQDRMGIPHVRFYTHLVRGSSAATALDSEQRTLALDSFCARYRERIRYNEKANCVEPLQ
ncbi:MAG: hypothetical protein WC464_08355 [Bdellovibrionales bacterium]